ncbi:restriction endonuclease subunit S [Staphylococcus haemolyticus]|uniref:restriction endonuclease subunit S n=1 Tax=Staphylococcus haemolyticus TaxID=1283 RepID=UPI0023B0B5AE|nr:restriction endonuclease subunit S [Staphylococcus haemolyticus]
MKKQFILLPVINNQPDYKFMEEYIKENYFRLKSVIKDKRKNEINDYRSLSEVDWKAFKLIDIFDSIQRGKRLTKNKQIDGNTPYISSTSNNNGINNFISNNNVRSFDNCLTLANSGSVGETFYHPYKFVASDHVTHLKENNLNKYTYLFIANMIKRIGNKYSFNREINDFRIKREQIILPTLNNQPDYDFMEQYMKRKENEVLERI